MSSNSKLVNTKKGKQRFHPYKKESILTMHSHLAPVAPKMRTKLKFSTDYTFLTTLAFDQQYRLNSLFDPDFTGVGAQPTGFDQLAALYEKYRVWSCRYVIKYLERGTVGSKLVIVPTNSSSSFASSQNAAFGLPFAKFGLCNQYSDPLVFTGKIDLALLNGRTHQQYIDDDTTGAAVNANPSEVLNLHVIMNSIDGGSNGNGCLLIMLEYDVEFYDPIMLSASFFKRDGVVVPSVPPKVEEQTKRSVEGNTLTSTPTSLLGMIGL